MNGRDGWPVSNGKQCWFYQSVVYEDLGWLLGVDRPCNAGWAGEDSVS